MLKIKTPTQLSRARSGKNNKQNKQEPMGAIKLP
jgi:hypothetical protein